jgi:hypothetical protein
MRRGLIVETISALSFNTPRRTGHFSPVAMGPCRFNYSYLLINSSFYCIMDRVRCQKRKIYSTSVNNPRETSYR